MKKKLTRKQFIELVKQGPVQVDKDTYYNVIKLNEENVIMSEMFKEQLKREGLYNRTYVGILTSQPYGPYDMVWLPIYGNVHKYETKHFKYNFEDAAMDDLSRRSTNLLNRHFEWNTIYKEEYGTLY